MMAWWTDSGSPLRVREVDVAADSGLSLREDRWRCPWPPTDWSRIEVSAAR